MISNASADFVAVRSFGLARLFRGFVRHLCVIWLVVSWPLCSVYGRGQGMTRRALVFGEAAKSGRFTVYIRVAIHQRSRYRCRDAEYCSGRCTDVAPQRMRLLELVRADRFGQSALDRAASVMTHRSSRHTRWCAGERARKCALLSSRPRRPRGESARRLCASVSCVEKA